jgi:hypothetical protein
MSKKAITRLFVGGIVVCFAGLVLDLAVVGIALAGGVVKLGGSSVVEVNGGLFAGTLVGLAVAGLLAISAGAVAGVASWIGALLNTVQLEDKTWFASLLVLGMLSMGTAAMMAYVLAGPDSTKQVVDVPTSLSVEGQP